LILKNLFAILLYLKNTYVLNCADSQMDFIELNKRYQQLLNENSKLKALIDEYRSRFGPLEKDLLKKSQANFNSQQIPSAEQTDNTEIIHNHSSPVEKIKLFLSLFKGRQDVYARLWQNQAGKSGYSPVCLNEWDRELCKKPQIKCTACKNQNFVPWNAIAVNSHLRGEDVLGIYPLLNDETCYFLAIDFDGEGWREDVTVLRNTCLKNNIPVAVERSRSGNGAHLWLFFSEKINAAAARKFGSALITAAMEKRHKIHFKSYDRFFPNQDTLPTGGFGNLIAMPLQKKAREKGNSVFIDENFNAIDDQWRFLSLLHKLTENEINKLTLQLYKGSELGDLRQADEEGDQPWIKSGTNRPLTGNDVPAKVQIVKADMLYIPKNGFSEKALNKLKRLAAFRNPAFFRAQAMRLSTWNKPRIISLAGESLDYLHLPRGCEENVNEILSPLKTEINWIDERFYGSPIEIEFCGRLHPEQREAVKALLGYNNGVLAAGTAFGKTIVAANLIAERKVNTLVLVHTRQLLEQWQERLMEFLIFKELSRSNGNKKRKMGNNETCIGQIGGGKNSLNGIVDIAIMQSLVRGNKVKDHVRNYGMVIVDECHHMPAFSFEQILRNTSAAFVYGLTATPARQDGHHPIIFMQCGSIRFQVDDRLQSQNRPFTHSIIPRFTSFKLHVKNDEQAWTIGEIYSEIGIDHMRNQLIIDDVLQGVKSGRFPIILTQRTAHVKTLADALSCVLPNVITLTGSMSAKERKEAFASLAGLPAGSEAVIVATGKFAGEGFDMPRLDTLFLAMPVAWKGTVQQYAGRLHRLFREKNEVQIFDYVDVHIGVLERMYHKRLRGYASMGYCVKGDFASFEEATSIFDDSGFFTVFQRDVRSARHEIVIVSPFIRKNRLTNMMELFADTIRRGIAVSIVTRPVSDFKAENHPLYAEMQQSIKQMGVNLILKTRIHQKFAVIDRRTVWYGSMNLLSFGGSEESMMRLQSVNIAHELLELVE
jgi:superfamily II DNA or RNA helicase